MSDIFWDKILSRISKTSGWLSFGIENVVLWWTRVKHFFKTVKIQNKDLLKSLLKVQHKALWTVYQNIFIITFFYKMICWYQRMIFQRYIFLQAQRHISFTKIRTTSQLFLTLKKNPLSTKLKYAWQIFIVWHLLHLTSLMSTWLTYFSKNIWQFLLHYYRNKSYRIINLLSSNLYNIPG